MAYLLDADVFIRAKNLHYGLDYCPAFWDWLIREHQAGKVFSIEKVSDEINAVNDELSDWAAALDDAFFEEPDENTLDALGTVSQWATSHTFANGQRYTPAAVSTFLQIGDYYLIAQALSGRHIVVTHEVPANSVNKVKIPNACLGVRVKYMTPYEMLRKEKARFVLG